MEHPAGQNALYQMLGMCGPLPHTLSYTLPTNGRQRTISDERHTQVYYPLSQQTDGTLRDNLRVIHAALVAIGPEAVAQWVEDEPTGRYSRLAWFYYERLTQTRLSLADVINAPYVDALDRKYHFVASSRRSSRHRVNDNLLGDARLCPILRRTPKLEQWVASRLGERVKAIAAQYSPATLNRATDYLYTRETRSSFDIESERPDNKREEQFLQILRTAAQFNLWSEKSLLDLQNAIVDARFAAQSLRKEQVYVSTRRQRGKEHVHYICPQAKDVPDLMNGLFELTHRTIETFDFDPVLAAALVSFAFVFIHPFEDGNGRIHRFLIHAVLAQRGFTPEGIIFPVSAAINRERDRYFQVLDNVSQPLKSCIQWEMSSDDEITVINETRDLYRFWDATPLAEYLYERVENTVTVDFQQELDYLSRFDAAFTAVQNIVDMPDRQIALIINLCLQNGGRLSKNKRNQFPLLTDTEIERISSAVQNILFPSTPLSKDEI